MKQFLIAVATIGLLSLGVSAQTSAQAAGSASGNTGVQAGQTSTNVNSSTSVDADANARRGNSNADANSSNSSSASMSGSSVNAHSAGSLAAGTTIPATLSKPIDARKAKSGDQVTAKTTQDIRSNAGVVIPRGSRLIGHVTDAKAKAKGDSESALGIAFDQAVLKNGEQIPLNASIRALAASDNASASMGDENFGRANNSSLGSDVSASAPRGGGGLLGGSGNAVGGATSAVGSAAGGAANGVDNTAANVGANAGGAINGATRGATGQLSSQSQGVIGMRGLSLSSAASNSTSGSVITSTGKDVRLDSGTQMLLQVNQ